MRFDQKKPFLKIEQNRIDERPVTIDQMQTLPELHGKPGRIPGIYRISTTGCI